MTEPSPSPGTRERLWSLAFWVGRVAVSGLAVVLLLWLCDVVPRPVRTVALESPQPEKGLAFKSPLPRSWPGFQWDRSTAVVKEDGSVLARGRSETRVRESVVGASFVRRDRVIFTSSDQTDPRTNGHRYTFQAEMAVLPITVAVAWLVTVAFFWPVLRQLWRWFDERVWPRWHATYVRSRPALAQTPRTLPARAPTRSARLGHWLVLAALALVACQVFVSTAIQWGLFRTTLPLHITRQDRRAFLAPLPPAMQACVTKVDHVARGSYVRTSVVFEDGHVLPVHEWAPQPVAKSGHGRYALSAFGVSLSASDGSSPLTNGRRYTLEAPRAPTAFWLGLNRTLPWLALAVGLAALLFAGGRSLAWRLLSNRWFLLAACVLWTASRQPWMLLRPPVNVEDGQFFFGYYVMNEAVSPLTRWFAGYLSWIPNLSAWLGCRLSIPHAPHIMAICAWLLRVGAVMLFSSRGFRHIVFSDALRGLICLALLLNPLADVLLTFSTAYSIWNAAFIGFLLCLARYRGWRLGAQSAGIVVIAWSNPLCLAFLPIQITRILRARLPLHRLLWAGVAAATFAFVFLGIEKSAETSRGGISEMTRRSIELFGTAAVARPLLGQKLIVQLDKALPDHVLGYVATAAGVVFILAFIWQFRARRRLPILAAMATLALSVAICANGRPEAFAGESVNWESSRYLFFPGAVMLWIYGVLLVKTWIYLMQSRPVFGRWFGFALLGTTGLALAAINHHNNPWLGNFHVARGTAIQSFAKAAELWRHRKDQPLILRTEAYYAWPIVLTENDDYEKFLAIKREEQDRLIRK